jgi:hypothetical protein
MPLGIRIATGWRRQFQKAKSGYFLMYRRHPQLVSIAALASVM